VTAVTAVLTPWYRRAAGQAGSGPDEPGSLAATAILDRESAAVQRLVARSQEAAASTDSVSVLAAAHHIIRDEVRPVYAMNEAVPASRTLRRGSGSCSQRLAILESVARALGVPTRVRALLIDRSFWYPRFPRIGFALPNRMLLAWPEFLIEGDWRSASELFGPIGCRGGGAFANRGAETLFEAVGRCAIDWDGQTHDDEYDLSRFVRADLGYFADRDDVFVRLGQTLTAPVRALVDPILRRISA
jgi:hypothetical protein